MRCSLFLFFALFINTFASIANENIIELEQKLEQNQQLSENQIPLLAKLVQQCWLKCPDKAKKYGEQALELLKKHSDINSFVIIAKYYPRVFIDKGELDKAQSIIDQYMSTNLLPDDLYQHASVLVNQGIIHKVSGRYLLARQAYTQALTTYKKLNKHRAIGNTLNNLALISVANKRFREGLAYYLEALPLLEQHGNAPQLTSLLSNIAEVYAELKDQDNALLFSSRAEKLALDIAPSRKTTEHFIKKGALLYSLGLMQEAEVANSEALKLLEQTPATDLKINTLINQALVFLDKARASIALQYLEDAITIAQQNNFNTAVNRAKFIKARALVLLERNTDAIELFYDVIESFKRDEQMIYYSDALDSLINILIDSAQFEQATQLLVEYVKFNKQQQSTQNSQSLAELRVLLNKHEQDQMLNELSQEKERTTSALTLQRAQNQTLTISIVATLLIAVAIVLWLMQKRKTSILQAQFSQELMNRKNRMLSEVAHELKTPLAAIKLQVETLEYDIADEPDMAYQTIHSKISSLNHLISDLFELSLADAGDLKINKTLNNVSDFMSNWYKGNKQVAEEQQLSMSITNDIAADVQCEFDRERINQVLSNLLTNSCRYTDKPGTIAISTRVEDKQIHITFEDSAPGMTKEFRKKVFDRLYRGDKSRSRELGGAGLGLSICKALVDVHGGQIECLASDLGGLKFDISLPCTQSEK